MPNPLNSISDLGQVANVADFTARIAPEPTPEGGTFTREEAQRAIDLCRDHLSRPLFEIALKAEKALQELPPYDALSLRDRKVFDLLEDIITDVAKAPLSPHYIARLLGK